MDWWRGINYGFPDLFNRRSSRLLAACWLCGMLILAAYGTVSGDRNEPVFAPVAVEAVGPANGTGPFVASHRGQGAAHTVTFDNSWILGEDSDSRKIMRIDNLVVRSSRSASAAEAGRVESLLAEFGRLPALFGVERSGLSEKSQAGGNSWTVGPDLTDAMEVRIQRMDWQVCRADGTVLRLRCGHALLQPGTGEILFGGPATLSTADAVLEGNCLFMDYRRDRLIVTGGFRLVRDKDIQRGKDGCFAADLSLLGTTPHVAHGPADRPCELDPFTMIRTCEDPAACFARQAVRSWWPKRTRGEPARPVVQGGDGLSGAGGRPSYRLGSRDRSLMTENR